MGFDDQDGSIWLDGEYVPWREAKIHVLTHTLHYGMGVYEGIRAYKTDKGPAIFRLDAHIDRFYRSAKMLNIKLPYDKKTLLTISQDIIGKNDLQAAYIRPMCFYGSEGMGLHANKLKPHVTIAAWAWGEYLGAGSLDNGVRIKTSSYRRISPSSLLTKAKANGHYINSMLALQEAQQSGFDEALMLDHQGYVAEGSGENFFMIRDNVVYTPMRSAILEGITRDSVMTICQDLGLEVKETNITRDEVYISDEAFFTGTAAEVTPIRDLDGRSIGEGKPGPLTLKIQKRYFDHVQGRMDTHQEWLTYV